MPCKWQNIHCSHDVLHEMGSTILFTIREILMTDEVMPTASKSTNAVGSERQGVMGGEWPTCGVNARRRESTNSHTGGGGVGVT